MPRCFKPAKSRSAKLSLRLAVTSILLLSIPACRVPGLRGAKHANPRPESFNLQTVSATDSAPSEEVRLNKAQGIMSSISSSMTRC